MQEGGTLAWCDRQLVSRMVRGVRYMAGRKRRLGPPAKRLLGNIYSSC